MTNKSAKMRSIAERLRSDSQNERTIAVHKIEAYARSPLSLIIRLGLADIRSNPTAKAILKILCRKGASANEGAMDQTLQAISVAISKSALTWGDIIEKGIEAVSLTKKTREKPTSDETHANQPIDEEDLLDEIMPGHDIYKTEGFRRFTRMARDLRNKNRKSQSKNTDKESLENEIMEGDNFLRITEEELPAIAMGIPYIAHYGETESREQYLKIQFHRLVTQMGIKMAPMCDFIASGDEWIGKIRHAETHRQPLIVMFGKSMEKERLVPVYDGTIRR